MSYAGQILSPPIAQTWSNVNWISGTSSANSGNSINFTAGTPSSGDHLVGQYYSSPSTPYCVIASIAFNQGSLMSLGGSGSTTKIWGIGFYDGTKAVQLLNAFSGDGNSATMLNGVFEWSNVSNLQNILIYGRRQSGFSTGTQKWFQIRDDGTTLYFYVAADQVGMQQPKHWVQIYSQGRTSYLSSPNHIGYFMDGNPLGNNPITVKSWQTVAL